QLRDKIAAALAEFMPNPEVSVTVMQVNSYRISVLGEVQKPGVLQLKAPTTVLEALALAGGFRDFASPSKIVIFRKDGTGQTQKPGVLQLKAPTTVLEALALAGGFRDFASPSKIVIFRKDGTGQTQKLRFNYNRAVGSAGEENVTLKSGDVVVVP